MSRLIICLLCCSLFVLNTTHAQNTIPLDTFMRYTDFHIHPTYKHYFRPTSAKMMQTILAKSSYNRVADVLTFDPAYRASIKDTNWTRYTNEKKPAKTRKAIQRGITSNLRNYDQAGYPEIMFVPGSILCNSYSPYEKQFALKKMNRVISSAIVTKMGLERLDSYAENNHTPLNDFMAEYYYNNMQEEEKFISTMSPQSLYFSDDTTYRKNTGYYNSIRMVRDSVELDSINRSNDYIFRNWKSSQPPPHIITPLVMSIEGAQVLYDTLSSQRRHILNPLNYSEKTVKNESFFSGTSIDTMELIHNELLRTVSTLKNLHHRLFFITLGHFAQNHVVGFAKTLDRDPENIQHRALSTITTLPRQRENLIHKGYAGFNTGVNMSDSKFKADSIGFKIVEAFLNPDSNATRFKKPTYIDVKHMDIEARIQYYYMRRNYEKKFNLKIPIIASHFGVSGETQAMAAATGLWPHFDMYSEVENIKRFYRVKMMQRYNPEKRWNYWTQSVMGGDNITSKNDSTYYMNEVLDPFDRAMYRPLDFYNDTIFNNRVYDPFKDYRVDKNKAGWYYPWSVNLFDEEIIEINKSDGIIGLLLDPRQLGAYMPNYKKNEKKFKDDFEQYKQQLTDADLQPYGISKQDLNEKEYFKTEPLIRNIFYIVQVIQQRKLEEEFYISSGKNINTTRARYPNYIADEVYTDKDPWKMISIGGDFDGLIDPIDFAPTASYIPVLRRRMIVYAWIFAQIRKDIFFNPSTKEPFISNLADSHQKMHQFFYANGATFILKYF